MRNYRLTLKGASPMSREVRDRSLRTILKIREAYVGVAKLYGQKDHLGDKFIHHAVLNRRARLAVIANNCYYMLFESIAWYDNKGHHVMCLGLYNMEQRLYNR